MNPPRRIELRVGIVGSRRRNGFEDRKIVFDIVERLVGAGRDVVLVSGACPKGADRFAADAARHFRTALSEHPIPKRDYPNEWEFTQAAYVRNREIVMDSDYVVALIHPDRTGGTENTLEHCRDLGKDAYLVDSDGRVTYVNNGHGETNGL